VESLEVRAANCTRCDLSQTRHRVVVGSGALTAQLAIVGEAPGRAEDEGGEPFIGRSGQLLFELVSDVIGLTRAECYVTNVVKCRPPANRTPMASEVDACRPWWVEQVRELAAKVILTLGNTATRAVLETREPITALRGRVHVLGERPVVATFHPAAALRGGASVVDQMREDLAVVRDVLESTA
jgi:DNA polymerase